MDNQQNAGLTRSIGKHWMFGVMGVVFGDIATSPLYALRIAFTGPNALNPGSMENVLGILSLVFWLMFIVVGLKYALFLLRADNKGEGGIMALMTLVQRGLDEQSRWNKWVVMLGLTGTALFFGDAMIAPAISVLSAMEGIKVAAPAMKSLIVPVTVAVLMALFMVQRRGTAFIGFLFSPVMMLWLLAIAGLGLISVVETPHVLMALNPLFAVKFLQASEARSLIVLGAVVLVVTGAEALYADMGHFGVKPIRRAWFLFVFPALVLNYLGQGALLMRTPAAASNPFYLLGPSWTVAPMLGLATFATIIASQAVISGAFSLARQAVQFGFLPRLNIHHTSSGQSGQIYIPSVNIILAIIVTLLVLVSGSSSRLAAAYGVAVTGTMAVTTLLAFGLLGRVWRSRIYLAGFMFSVFLVIDTAFLVANAAKIMQGGWVSLLAAGVVFTILATWRRGRDQLFRRLTEKARPLEEIVANLDAGLIPRVPGTAIYLTGAKYGVPVTLARNLDINKVLHERVIILKVVTRDEPWVPLTERIKVRDFGRNVFRVRIYYGYNQQPDIPHALEACQAHGLAIDLADTTFFLARESMVSGLRSSMAHWRERLFIRMAVNAANPTVFWRIPVDRVVELGLVVEL